MTTVKFNNHHVASAGQKARCHYSVDNRYGGGRCVTIYAKDFESGRVLGGIFPEQYVNRTDTQSDYFDMGHVELMEGHPHYAAARVRAEAWAASVVRSPISAPVNPHASDLADETEAFLAPPRAKVAAVEPVEPAPRPMIPLRDWCAENLSPGAVPAATPYREGR